MSELKTYERNTVDEMIAVIQAYKRGEKILSGPIGCSCLEICPEPSWSFGLAHYAPAPKRVEKWGNVRRDDARGYYIGRLHDNEAWAKQCGNTPNCVATVKIEFEEKP